MNQEAREAGKVFLHPFIEDTDSAKLDLFVAGWNARPGMVWVPTSERLPPEGEIVLFDMGENPPVWGSVNVLDKRPYITTFDSSGEEESDNLDMDSQWLSEETAESITRTPKNK